MVVAPSSISNYFTMLRIDEFNAKSNPPYISGPFTADRTFGGLLVSQAVNVFSTLLPGRIPHTINYKFVTTVKTQVPLHFKLRHFDDGKTTSSIWVYQNDKLVGIGHILYALESQLIHFFPPTCPDYGPPEAYPTSDNVARERPSPAKELFTEFGKFPVEFRIVESPLYPLSEVDRAATWMRIKPEFGGDIKPTDGISVTLFMSDLTVFRVPAELYQKSNIMVTGSSLNHSVWIHEPSIDPLGWFLLVSECQSIAHGRARIDIRLFNESRACVMSVVQEAYFQRFDSKL